MNDGAERRRLTARCLVVQQEWRRAHAKGAEDAEGKGRPRIEEDWGRCFAGCGPQPPKVGGASAVGGGRRAESGDRKPETGEDQAAVHTGIDRRARSASLSLSVCCRTGLDGSANRSRQRPVSVSRTRKTRRPSASWIDSMRGVNSLFCKAEFMEKV